MIMRQTFRRHRGAAALAVATLLAALSASPAWATSEHYFSGGLSYNRAYASSSAHTHVNYSQAVGNGTGGCFRAAISWGAAGYFYGGDAGTLIRYGACGNGTQTYYPFDYPDYYHGTVWNTSPSQTNASVNDAHYTW
jgi:hypothetical protein